MGTQKKQFVISFAILSLASAVFLIPFCGLIYQCGCTFLWSGGVQNCNIHQAAGPHCPWCQAGENPFLGMLPVMVILGGQGLALFYFSKRPGSSYLKLFLVGVLAFWIFGTAIGYVFKLIYNYPHFFVD